MILAHVKSSILWSFVLACLLPHLATAQLNPLWIRHAEGAFYDLEYDSDTRQITLTTLADSVIHIQEYSLAGLEGSSTVIPIELSRIQGYRPYRSGFIVWALEGLECQTRYCKGRVTIGRTDESGRFLWTKRFETWDDIRVTAVHTSSQGNFIFSLMESSQWGAGAYLIELDPNGQERWRVQIPAYSTPHVIEETEPHTFAVFGTVAQYGRHGADSELICPFVITVRSGNILSRDCLLRDAGGQDFLGFAKDDSDELIFAIGDDQPTQTTFRLVHTDSVGSVHSTSEGALWTGSDPRGSQFSVAQSPDGDLWLAGLTGVHPEFKTRIARLKATGETVWEETLSVSGDSDSPVKSILPLPDGSVLIGGQSEKTVFLTRIRVAEGTSTEVVDARRRANVSVYPTPAHESVSIEITVERPTAIDASIYDLTGKRVHLLHEGSVSAPGTHVFKWDGRNDSRQTVPTGVYFVTVLHGGGLSTASVVFVR